MRNFRCYVTDFWSVVKSGWYILRNWNDADFDKNKILTELHVKYGVSPYFKITVEPNPTVEGKHSLRISPSGLGLPDREYYYSDSDDRIQTAYKKLIRDVVIYMNGATTEANKFGTDIFSYEKRIAEITPDSSHLENPLNTYESVPLSELKQVVQIPFLEILMEMYKDSNINDDTEVYLTSPDYLTHVAQIISTTDRMTMNGYLIWTLVRNYLPHLSDDFTSAVDSFNSELYGIQAPSERYVFCTKMTKKIMGLASDVLLEIDKPLTKDVITVVNSTFYDILNVVKEKVNAFQRYPNLVRHLKLKLDDMRLQIGLPDKVKNIEYLKKYYAKLKVLKTNWFDTMKQGIMFQKYLEERKLMSSPEEDIVIAQTTSEDPPSVTYSPAENVILIPRILLSEPIFESKFPKSIVYGRLGVEIANAILTGILPYQSIWASNKRILSPFHNTVNESMDSVNSTTNCLTLYILGLNLSVPASRANATALRILKQSTAVSIANEALLKSLVPEPHTHQPALEEFEDSALFFLSYAQTQCSEMTNQRQLYENIVNFGLSQKTVLHIIWSQLPEFSEAFDCRFNKKFKCGDIF